MSKTNIINTNVIDARQGTKIGVLELNKTKSLNALDLEMVDAMDAVLRNWASDKQIGMVILKSADPKAFSAGGDVRKLHDWAKANQNNTATDNYAEDFFEHEYRLDYLLYKYPKPVLCWAEGVTMGGGFGLFSASSHKVATESTKFAIPEITIGLFPDAGGTELLASLKEPCGLFLGLTGAVIRGADAVYYEIADYCISSHNYQSVLADITNTAWSGSKDQLGKTLYDLICDYDTGPLGPFEMPDNQPIFESLKDASSYQEVIEVMLGFDSADASDWMRRALANFHGGCPLTAALIVEQLKRAGALDLAGRFRMEMNIAAHCVRGTEFIEGVRALLIDKDRKPKWHYQDFKTVPPNIVQEHFESLWSDHPLADLDNQ